MLDGETPSSKAFLHKPNKQKGPPLADRAGGFLGGVERGEKGHLLLRWSHQQSHTLHLPCAKYGLSEVSEVDKTQPKPPKNSWSSWQNRYVNRQKQHKREVTMEAWCVCVGSTAVGVWKRGQLWKERRAIYMERGENRGLEVTAGCMLGAACGLQRKSVLLESKMWEMEQWESRLERDFRTRSQGTLCEALRKSSCFTSLPYI